MKLIVNSTPSLQSALGVIREEYEHHKYLRLDVKSGKDRSLSQNDQSHVWYEQLAKELRENTALGWKGYCKLHFGVPILRSEDEAFRNFYDAGIKKLTYEQKIEAMNFVPVTSLMKVSQLSQYLAAMQDYFVPLGVMLEFLDDHAK